MFKPGELFSGLDIKHTGVSVHNGVWWNLIGQGNFFLGLDADTFNKLVLTFGEQGPEDIFSGLDSGTLNKSILTVGEPSPDWANFFF